HAGRRPRKDLGADAGDRGKRGLARTARGGRAGRSSDPRCAPRGARGCRARGHDRARRARERAGLGARAPIDVSLISPVLPWNVPAADTRIGNEVALTPTIGGDRTMSVKLNKEDCILFSGAAQGAESAFGAAAERHGVEEVNFTFDGHSDARSRGIRVLTSAELKRGDVSLAYVSRLMHRDYRESPLFRKVLQTIWHQVNNGQEIYVVGHILEDDTVKGGTGWGAEFAKLCNKPLLVFDQE